MKIEMPAYVEDPILRGIQARTRARVMMLKRVSPVVECKRNYAWGEGRRQVIVENGKPRVFQQSA